MIGQPLAAAQRGTAVPESSFSDLIARLTDAYRDWELPAIFLATHLNEVGERVRLNVLANTARDAFFDAHAGKALDRKDPQFSEESFRNVALHAVAALQHKAVELFEKGENQPGYMLLVSDVDVRWQPWRDGI